MFVVSNRHGLVGIACRVETASASPDIFVERPTARSGTGVLEVRRVGSKSVVTRAFAMSPLRWLTPRNHGHAAWIFSSTFGGGLVDGDAIDVSVDVEHGATALISTQASTKVYRSPVSGVRSDLRARVAREGCLVFVPDPLVPFASARSAQRLEVDLEPEASLVLVDWLSSGRRARGERWQFNALTSFIRIRQAGRLICHDAVTLAAADGDLSERLGRFDVLATVVLAGPVAAEAAASLVAASAAAPPQRRADLVSVAAPIGDRAAHIRLAGTSVEQVGRAIRAALGFVPLFLGDDPWARKW